MVVYKIISKPGILKIWRDNLSHGSSKYIPSLFTQLISLKQVTICKGSAKYDLNKCHTNTKNGVFHTSVRNRQLSIICTKNSQTKNLNGGLRVPYENITTKTKETSVTDYGEQWNAIVTSIRSLNASATTTTIPGIASQAS